MDHKKTLNATEICAIIKASYKYNVRKLRVGDFECEFETLSSRGNAERVFVNQRPGEETPVAANVQSETEATPFVPDRELMEDLRLAQLMTDDPVAYEQEMIDANLDRQVVLNETEDSN